MSEIKTTEQLIEEIKRLPEIELDELLHEVGQHLYRNKLEHLIDSAFQMDDQTEQIEELEEEVRDFESILSSIQSLTILYGTETEEDLKKIITEVNDKSL